ncbi:unnamed protein product [Ectocarpus fasciculatus]
MAFRQVDPGVQRLWDQLEDEEHAILVERRRLQDIWKQISTMHKKNAEAREAFEKEAAFDFVGGEERIVLNIGGQKFQTTAGVLCRDRFSLLACICKVTPPIPKGEDGSYFFERDWWIFRYVLQFLRTGDLPQDKALLHEMYGEAAFYRLSTLRRAIQRRAVPTAITGGTVASTQTGATRLGREASASSKARHEGLLHSTGSNTTEGVARLQRPQQPARTRGLFREPLPDPFGFSGKGK